MKKPVGRLLYPNTGWYFAAMLLFTAAAAAVRQYILAGGALFVTLIMFIISRARLSRRKRQLMSYVQTATDSVGISVHAGSAFPMAVIRLPENEIIWGNPSFFTITGLSDTACYQTLDAVIPGFSTSWLREGRSELPGDQIIGIGKDGGSFAENYRFASLAIEMSLSRGGDQAVIKDRFNFTFYGGRTKEAERHTRVKSRVMAGSLSELIGQSSTVYIMGHRMADLDALGSAVGLLCLCRVKERPARIVIDLQKNACQSLIAELKAAPGCEDLFISGQDALVEADNRSLLIVVDTNRPEQVECRPLLESISRVAVIDHHRRAADYIEQPVLNLQPARRPSARGAGAAGRYRIGYEEFLRPHRLAHV